MDGWHVIAIIEELEHQHGEHVPVEDIHTESHFMWGSYFSTINETNEPKKTFWADLISKNIDLAIPCLSTLFELPLDYEHHKTKNHILSPCAIYYEKVTTRSKYYSAGQLK